MVYDEDVADRIRSAIQDQDGVSKKRMFGGLAFLVNGTWPLVRAASAGSFSGSIEPVCEDGVTRIRLGELIPLARRHTQQAAH